jgi:hypothetical protein
MPASVVVACAVSSKPSPPTTTQPSDAPGAQSGGATVRYVAVDLRLFKFPFDDRHGMADNVPLDIRRLDGERVRIQGEMIPIDQSDKLSQFMLVPELKERTAPLLQQSVWVHMARGKLTDYKAGQVKMEGIFHVDVETDDGYVVAIFELTDGSFTGPAVSTVGR